MSTVGFDFGTTNSLVSAIEGDRAINFFDDRGLPIPSVVCYEAGNRIVGRQAKQRMATAGLGVYGNIVRSPKMLLNQSTVFVDGVERSVVDIVTDLVRYVRDESLSGRGRTLARLDRAVVTIPVNFDGSRRIALRDAFQQAGIRIVQFVHEPLAALYRHVKTEADQQDFLRRHDRRLLLVFDWGGGTLDLTLCRLEGGTLVQLATDGTDSVGGDRFDEVIKNEVVRRARRDNTRTALVPHRDADARLLHLCEDAKIQLSNRERFLIYLDDYFRDVHDGSLEYDLSRDELDSITRPLVDEGLGRIRAILETARISPAQVSLCLATGGMVNMPVIRARLHELFGPQRVCVSSAGGAAIAEGAAWIAHDKARLRLAKHVELLLARNSYLQLIAAGATMPVEREVHKDQFQLYCADPRDGHAKLQLVTPLVPGSTVLSGEPRIVLDTMSLPVDAAARPFFERLELNVRIDENMILHARAHSALSGNHVNTEIHHLEFGIAIGEQPKSSVAQSSSSPQLVASERRETGAVVVRANVADHEDHSLVPGELAYKEYPEEFDTRRNPPRIQVDERLYYEPCAKCGRASNDPDCRCGRKTSK